jgi:hypothetical protein
VPMPAFGPEAEATAVWVPLLDGRQAVEIWCDLQFSSGRT